MKGDGLEKYERKRKKILERGRGTEGRQRQGQKAEGCEYKQNRKERYGRKGRLRINSAQTDERENA